MNDDRQSLEKKACSRRARRRLAILLCVLVLWTAGIGYRLYRLQVVQHDEYVSRAERQQQRIVELDAPRGTIFDARGRELAVSVQVESVYAVPSEIDSARIDATATALAKPLHLPASQIARQLSGERDFVWLMRKLEPEQSQAVRALDLPGVYLLPESKRYYPLGDIAAHVLGYVGTDNVGLGGIESTYDGVVSGKTARRTVLRDVRGRFLDVDLSFADALPGEDLILTLDATLQWLAEKELRRAVRGSGAKAGSVVLLDARDSAVLAMASVPNFDPNRFTEFAPPTWRNRAVMDAFEPGSTFKMVTAAAVVQHDVVRPDDLFDCGEGGITLASTFIRDHKPFGVMTFREVIARSSNVGTIKAAERLGGARFYDMVEALGFGRPTGIDLEGESAGIVRPKERWTELATAYGSFGMGLSVTAVQLANAFATVARGGEVQRPYVVARTSRSGATGSSDRRPSVAMSPRTAVVLTELLEAVVREGTGKAASIPGYRVAGKTGTAEKSDRTGYSETGRVASFVGFAPVSEPRLVALVVLDEPRTSIYGGEVAAPAFSALVGEALLYLGVAPDEVSPATAQIARRLRWIGSDREDQRLELSERREAVNAQLGASVDATL